MLIFFFSPVSSTAENSTLLQIILDSTPNKRNNITNRQTQNLTNQNSLQNSNQNYHSTNYKSTDEFYTREENDSTHSENNFKRNHENGQVNKVDKSIVRKRVVDPKVRAQNYISEFESLSIRCEAMREEENTVMKDVEETNREITQQRVRIHYVISTEDIFFYIIIFYQWQHIWR